jgi:hypothetical protein
MEGSRYRWLKRLGLALALLFVVTLAGVTIVAYRLNPIARAKAVELLEKEFGNVELVELDVQPIFGFRLTPSILARGKGLSIGLKDRNDVPPLISMNEFEVDIPVSGLLSEPVRLKKLTLDRLEIQIPPGRDDANGLGDPEPDGKRSPTGRDGVVGESHTEPGLNETPQAFVIEQIDADGTVLRILPKDPEKEPLQFDLHELELQSVGPREPMSFKASLDNAKPPGRIDTEGTFGPWRLDEPGMSPIQGSYVFEDADLSVFGGIAGLLCSEGSFSGRLGSIEVKGHTDTPDFRLEAVGRPVHLRTEFHAVVDGTSGDTHLRPVAAQIETSRFETSGDVAREPNARGKVVRLDARSSRARIEDFLRLAVKSDEPILRGDVRFQSNIVIPPGDVDIVQKLELDGTFEIEHATFPKSVQEKIQQLSETARGVKAEKNAGAEARVVSNLSGNFVLESGVMTMTDLTFSVPGAEVALDGTLGLVSKALDFRGVAELDAKLSEMTTGVPSTVLEFADLLFARDGKGAVFPVKITGTTDDPKVGLELGKLFKR